METRPLTGDLSSSKSTNEVLICDCFRDPEAVPREILSRIPAASGVISSD